MPGKPHVTVPRGITQAIEEGRTRTKAYGGVNVYVRVITGKFRNKVAEVGYWYRFDLVTGDISLDEYGSQEWGDTPDVLADAIDPDSESYDEKLSETIWNRAYKVALAALERMYQDRLRFVPR